MAHDSDDNEILKVASKREDDNYTVVYNPETATTWVRGPKFDLGIDDNSVYVFNHGFSTEMKAQENRTFDGWQSYLVLRPVASSYRQTKDAQEACAAYAYGEES